MAKPQKTESMEKDQKTGINLLPEEMIQHIQSFLTGKEAVKTGILSKSWHNAWLTHPHLHFDDIEIPNKHFHKFVSETMQRYSDSNLKIHSFTLRTMDEELFTEVAVKALKLGATHLNLAAAFVLPEEVLDSETLIGLSLNCCKISSGKVNWGRIKSLRLYRVRTDVDVIDGILSSCCHTLEKLIICSSPVSPLNMCQFDNLRFLFLKNNKIRSNFFKPLLKD